MEKGEYAGGLDWGFTQLSYSSVFLSADAPFECYTMVDDGGTNLKPYGQNVKVSWNRQLCGSFAPCCGRMDTITRPLNRFVVSL